MLGAVFYQFKAWAMCLAQNLVMPAMMLVSPAWRKKNIQASLIYTNPFWNHSLPLSSLLSDPLDIRVVPLKAAPHNTTELELLALGAVVRQTQATSIFEIGTFDGRTTRTLAANTTDQGKVWTLNLPPGEDSNSTGLRNVDSLLNVKVKSGHRFQGTEEACKIEQVYGDSATFDFTPHRESIELVFIDGSHTEQYVEIDTISAIKMLKPEGGVILWHDSLYYGVVTYLQRQIQAKGWHVRWIEGTTLAIAYFKNGETQLLPLPLPSFTH